MSCSSIELVTESEDVQASIDTITVKKRMCFSIDLIVKLLGLSKVLN